MQVRVDPLTDPRVIALLEEHLAHMRETTPAEHVFALDVGRLQAPGITFFTAWEGDELLGCGALRELAPDHGEVKSMRTPSARRGRGAGRAILDHLIAEARRRGYRRLSLETGTHPAFGPAQALYRSAGFAPCGPFGEYAVSPDNTFFALDLALPTIPTSRLDPRLESPARDAS
ncbi:MAG TPA: GNAT family N-acetyltransferase [Gemmatimonadales bacterium]|nr:GNAT family N-acetyltransferase [Gemmatimonadales bacterium]